MSYLILYFDFALLVLDFITIADLREFLTDFLVVKRNVKHAREIHRSQPLKDRITLNYIASNIKKYTKEFSAYHRIYLSVLYTLIPQYIILIICNCIWKMKSMYVVGVFAAVKLIICLIIRLNVDANRISIYRQK